MVVWMFLGWMRVRHPRILDLSSRRAVPVMRYVTSIAKRGWESGDLHVKRVRSLQWKYGPVH